MRVLPTSGASTQAATASAPNPAIVHASRARIDFGASVSSANRHHRHATGTRMELHVRVDAVETPDVLRRQDVVRGALREHLSLPEQDDAIAERRSEVE